MTEARIKDVTCPQCRQPFVLRWQDYENVPGEYVTFEPSPFDPHRERLRLPKHRNVKVTLEVRGCPSGGVYDVIVRCPHCDYEEPL